MVTVSSQRVTVYNRTDGPVLIDAAGHMLGGNEYRSVREDEPEVQLGEKRGALVVVADPGGDLAKARPDAAEAIKATRKANAHRRKPAADSNDGDNDQGA